LKTTKAPFRLQRKKEEEEKAAVEEEELKGVCSGHMKEHL